MPHEQDQRCVQSKTPFKMRPHPSSSVSSRGRGVRWYWCPFEQKEAEARTRNRRCPRSQNPSESVRMETQESSPTGLHNIPVGPQHEHLGDVRFALTLRALQRQRTGDGTRNEADETDLRLRSSKVRGREARKPHTRESEVRMLTCHQGQLPAPREVEPKPYRRVLMSSSCLPRRVDRV